MHSEFDKRFKRACIEARAPAGQDQLAKYLGISGAMVSFLRNGKRLPSATIGKQIATKLRVSYDWLMLGKL
jgi:transcriptional regulator with XRE-family HTH domain